MDWGKQPLPPAAAAELSGIFTKVMSDEQMEVLRKQITAYAIICQQLVELHKSLTDFGAGNLYHEPLITTSGAQEFTGIHRWTPTPMQLQILERIFDQGTGNPNKPKIKQIATELSQHGPISESNVYNWFQNRRARSKRKQKVTPTNNSYNINGESEVETELVGSPSETKTKKGKHNFHRPCLVLRL
ncbi:hypothetical protein ACJIZ3_018558 [Penstemon smallii]|uniref:Homeobox domain-containing protein n=1 Tax=Penstemon smallii TaxID=265156 RepID=A0ABD3SZB7_9LAMI